MGDEINEADYWAAIDRALQWIQQKPHSVGAEALTTLLANVWDTIVPANAGEIMQMLNDERREIALDLLIGRSQHGRPIQHPRHSEVEALSVEVFMETRVDRSSGGRNFNRA